MKSILTILTVLSLLLAAPEEEEAIAALAFDPGQAPGRPVPADRWGALRPVLYENCVQLRLSAPCTMSDVTHISPLTEPGDSPFYHDIAVSGSYIFTATGQGMKIFEVSSPTIPVPFTYVDASIKVANGGGLWTFSDKNFFLTSIAAPSNNSNIVVTGNEDFGFIAWNTTNKGSVSFRYQDSGPFVIDVYATAIGTREFAFSFDNTATISIYDLTAISALSNCYEQNDSCSGAFKGTLPKGQSRGGAIDGAGDYIAYRDFLTLQILDVSQISSFPAVSPPVKLQSTLVGVTGVGEVAMWQTGSQYYLALPVDTTSGGQTWVYDVSCITGGGQCSLPNPVVYDTSTPTNPQPLSVDVSFGSNGTPYLYVGTNAASSVCTTQREYFFDASNPNAMVELTPQVPGKPYWGWYDEACVGFNGTAPRHGVVHGATLYRADYTILDSHSIEDAVPEEEVLFVDGFESGDASGWSSP